MAPEQAKGKPVDKRADIWAFGVVLFEVLTGRPLYTGETAPDTLARVIEREPDLSALPAATPGAIRDLIGRCLTKDPRTRLQAAGEARIVLERAIAHPEAQASSAASGAEAAYTPPPIWRRALPWAVAGALGVGLASVLALWPPWRTPPPRAPVRVSVELGADASLASSAGDAVALSPDGDVFAFVAQKSAGATSQLYVRRLGQLQATPLSGTDGARDPFFSPDGQWIAFFADMKLKKISVTGGAAVTLCDVVSDRGGSWAEDDTIVFQPDTRGSLLRVSSAGGKPDALTTLDEGEVTQRFPQVLPGGKAVLYTGHSNLANFDDANIVVQPMSTGVRKVVQRGGYHGRYLPSGHLVYMHDGTLFAQPFDLDRLEATGQPVPVLEGISSFPSPTFVGTAAVFASSGNGTMVFLPGQSVRNDASISISWMDRAGKTTPLRTTPANWSNPNFAPDGRRLAVDIFDGKQLDVWVYEWERDTLSRLTFDAADDGKPVWTADGRRIVFGSAQASTPTRNLYWRRADGTGEVQRLTESKNNQSASSWHPSGKFLAFQEVNPQTADDLMILPMEGDESSGWKPGKPTVFLNSPFQEREPMFSPDGRWLAYSSNESGRFEVYVRPFPGPVGGWQISSGGGVGTRTPAWSRTRRELFYNTPDNLITVASYTVEGESFRAEKPRLWSEAPFTLRPRQRTFDLHPDGARVAVAALPEAQAEARQDKVVFIFNFFDELRRIAPPTKR
jgi:serine/threonine-protein kinase